MLCMRVSRRQRRNLITCSSSCCISGALRRGLTLRAGFFHLCVINHLEVATEDPQHLLLSRSRIGFMAGDVALPDVCDTNVRVLGWRYDGARAAFRGGIVCCNAASHWSGLLSGGGGARCRADDVTRLSERRGNLSACDWLLCVSVKAAAARTVLII